MVEGDDGAAVADRGTTDGPSRGQRVLLRGLTVDAVTDLDLSYAPPYRSPWDPV
jgi:hypothetical protein